MDKVWLWLFESICPVSDVSMSICLGCDGHYLGSTEHDWFIIDSTGYDRGNAIITYG